MPQTITEIDMLQKYISGVMDRADHHAGQVNEITLALVGAIIWKKDDDPIEVFTREGNMANVIWVNFGGERHAFSYNHENATIELRQGSTHGIVKYSFTNNTKLSEIIDAFQNL